MGEEFGDSVGPLYVEDVNPYGDDISFDKGENNPFYDTEKSIGLLKSMKVDLLLQGVEKELEDTLKYFKFKEIGLNTLYTPTDYGMLLKDSKGLRKYLSKKGEGVIKSVIAYAKLTNKYTQMCERIEDIIKGKSTNYKGSLIEDFEKLNKSRGELRRSMLEIIAPD